MKLMAALCGLLLAGAAWAAPDVVVSGVKMPAWVVRSGERLPLAPDMELRSEDALLTGAGGRVLLTSADGSAIKLGENARMQLSGMAQYRHDEPMFTALLDVAKGAFRFTTSALAKLRKREVMVKVAGATVGIRGTDVWGKVGGAMKVADMEKARMGKALEGRDDKQAKMAFDVVCLIEGRIDVAHDGEEAFVMNEPLTFYVMPKGEAPLAVSELSREQITKWALETEIVAGQGAARSGGRWKVNLMEVEGEAALAAYDQLRLSGYDARLQPLAEGRFRLRIMRLPSRTEAEALARELTGKMGIQAPTVSR